MPLLYMLFGSSTLSVTDDNDDEEGDKDGDKDDDDDDDEFLINTEAWRDKRKFSFLLLKT